MPFRILYKEDETIVLECVPVPSEHYIFRPDPPWEIVPSEPVTLQYRLLTETGDEFFLPSGKHVLEIRTVSKADGTPGPWSDPAIIELPEPSVVVQLAALLLGLAVLAWWRLRALG